MRAAGRAICIPAGGTNPTIQELEQGLAALEGAEAALAFASGMAAISATILAHGRRGVVCIGDLYGGTQELLTNHCRPLGIPVTFLARDELDKLDGVLVTLEIEGGRDAAATVADNLERFLLATSLGGVESLVSQPCATSHHGISREDRERQGITDGMLRLSVGLEDAGDLINDLERALGALSET